MFGSLLWPSHPEAVGAQTPAPTGTDLAQAGVQKKKNFQNNPMHWPLHVTVSNGLLSPGLRAFLPSL